MAKKQKTFSDMLRERIKASGLTHYAIAKRAGTVPQVIDRFMEGNDLRGVTIDKLADAFDCVLAPRFSWFVAVCCDVELFPERDGDVLHFMDRFVRAHNSVMERIDEDQKSAVFADLWSKFHGLSQTRFDAFACQFSFYAEALAKHAAEALRRSNCQKARGTGFKVIIRCRWPGQDVADENLTGDVGILSKRDVSKRCILSFLSEKGEHSVHRRNPRLRHEKRRWQESVDAVHGPSDR